MIRIGLSEREKTHTIKSYLRAHDIQKIFCFYYKKYKPAFSSEDFPEIEYIEYSDIIMYKYFYRLLEEIGESSLVVINECLRTQKRSDLTYNCAHHYLGQTPHKIIFEFFPFIEKKEDIMILLDMEHKGKYKGKGFAYSFLKDEDFAVKPFRLKIDTIPTVVSDADKTAYEKRKEFLFDNIGSKDPDTIPRDLQLFVGSFKKPHILPEKRYVARNSRFKMGNVYPYDKVVGVDKYVIIDPHYRRLNFNDFIKTSKNGFLQYLCTPLPIDKVMLEESTAWKARLDAVYAQSCIYNRNS